MQLNAPMQSIKLKSKVHWFKKQKGRCNFQWWQSNDRGLGGAVQGIQYMFGVRAFLPPNLHQIVPQDPGQTECIWSPICLLQKCPHHSVVVQKISKGGFSIWRIQAHNFQVSRKLLIGSRISVLLQNIPPFSKGGHGLGSKTVEMLS